jgi:C4-type Zn-finger protein
MYSHAEGHRNKISGTFATHVEGILNDIQEWVDPTFDPEDPESTGYADEMLHSYAAHAEGSHNIVRGYAAHA